MKKNIFEDVNNTYSYLDIYEAQWNIQQTKEKINKTKPPQKEPEVHPVQSDKTYLNNYPDFDVKEPTKEERKKSQITNESMMQQDTKYGRITNKNIQEEQLQTYEDALKAFELDDIQSAEQLIDEDDREEFNKLESIVKTREIRFYAFLNKEFNILNQKLFKCCTFCYSNPTLFSISEAKACSERCYDNINDARSHVQTLQEENEEKLQSCLESAKTIDAQDNMVRFSKCYDQMLFDLDKMEGDIQNEFSNYL